LAAGTVAFPDEVCSAIEVKMEYRVTQADACDSDGGEAGSVEAGSVEAGSVSPVAAGPGEAGSYKLFAEPILAAEGDGPGELHKVAFVAESQFETMRWYVVNAGQLERVFSKLIPRALARRLVQVLRRGDRVEFPGLYERKKLGSGFHFEWLSVVSELPYFLVREGQDAGRRMIGKKAAGYRTENEGE
jgi:hypothetical protein